MAQGERRTCCSKKAVEEAERNTGTVARELRPAGRISH